MGYIMLLEQIRILCEGDDFEGLDLSDLFSLYCYLDEYNVNAEVQLMKDIVELRIKDICESKSKICLRV